MVFGSSYKSHIQGGRSAGSRYVPYGLGTAVHPKASIIDQGIGARPTELSDADLFIRKLPPELNSEGLMEMLKAYGVVTSARVIINVRGQSARYGFATMSTAEEAQRVILALNGWNELEVKIAATAPGHPKVKAVDQGINILPITPGTIIPSTPVRTKALTTDRGIHEHGSHYSDMDLSPQGAPEDCWPWQTPATAAQGLPLAYKSWYKPYAQGGRGGTSRYAPYGLATPVHPKASIIDQGIGERPTEMSDADLFIRKLPADLNSEGLMEMLKPFGTVTSARVIINVRGQSARYGFATMSTTEEAQNVIQALNGWHDLEVKIAATAAGQPKAKMVEQHTSIVPLQVGTITSSAPVRPQMPAVDHGVGDRLCDPTNADLFIRNLPLDMNSKGLMDMLMPFGVVTSARVIFNIRGQSARYGFATMASPDEAQCVIVGLHGWQDLEVKLAGNLAAGSPKVPVFRSDAHSRPAKTAKVGGSKPMRSVRSLRLVRTERSKVANATVPDRGIGERPSQISDADLFIRKLPVDLNSEGLMEMLRPFGTVTSARVIFNVRGQSARYGFASMSSAEEAQCVILALNGWNDLEIKVAGSLPGRASKVAIFDPGFLMGLHPVKLGKIAKIAKKIAKAAKIAKFAKFAKFARFAMTPVQPKMPAIDHGIGQRPTQASDADLFIRCLPKEMTSPALMDLLRPFGTVTSARVIFNVKGQSSRYGFATMASPEEAHFALLGLNGWNGLEVKVAATAPRQPPVQGLAEVPAQLQVDSPLQILV